MGTWNNKINGNDTFQDIYRNYFHLYNEGKNPSDISKKIQNDFVVMFNAYDDRNNSFFGLALAQWKTKSLDPIVYKQVKEIIESGNDLVVWKELGADEKSLKQRKKILDKFLIQISQAKENPKRRIKPKFEFEFINLIDITAPDNLKKFEVNEEYTNKQYVHTGGLMMWEKGGGGSVLNFTAQGKNISAKWLDNKTLEVTYDQDIVFTMQKENAFFDSDEIRIIYKGETWK